MLIDISLVFPEDAKDGDLINSLLHSLCENLAQHTYYVANNCGVRRVYIVGNFVNPPIVRRWVTKYMSVRNATQAKVWLIIA